MQQFKSYDFVTTSPGLPTTLDYIKLTHSSLSTCGVGGPVVFLIWLSMSRFIATAIFSFSRILKKVKIEHFKAFSVDRRFYIVIGKKKRWTLWRSYQSLPPLSWNTDIIGQAYYVFIYFLLYLKLNSFCRLWGAFGLCRNNCRWNNALECSILDF